MMEKEKLAEKTKVIKVKGNSLFILNENNCLRIIASKIVGHQYFDNTVLLLIIVSTILLALEKPSDVPGS